MAKAKKKIDLYDQEVCLQMPCDHTAGGAPLHVLHVPSAFSPKDRVGLVISRIEWCHTMAEYLVNVFAALGDVWTFGLSFLADAPEIYGFNPDDVGLVDYNRLELNGPLGPAAPTTAWIERFPIVKDFTGKPGGGKLVHPSVLYVWSGTNTALASALLVLTCRIHYTTVDLSEDDYRELWEARVISQTV
jgi:hypothetical protein